MYGGGEVSKVYGVMVRSLKCVWGVVRSAKCDGYGVGETCIV